MLNPKERNDNANYGTLCSANGNLIENESTTTCPSQTLFEPQGDYEVTTLIATDTEALSHQIAGHSRTGVLKHKLGHVLKPLQKEPLGSREVAFYRKVFGSRIGFEQNDNATPPVDQDGDGDKSSSLTSQHQLLQKYLPKFYGVVKILSTDPDSPEPGTLTWKHYIALQDLVDGFAKPCVIDVKIGAKTWDPSAPPKKVAHEKSKYLGTKEPLGLSLTGMQYYDLGAQKTQKMAKELGKTLVVSTFIETIFEFFNGACNPIIPSYIAKKLLPRLKEIQEYFQVQREFCYYSSSLLIGYDAERFEGQCSQKNYNWQGLNDDPSESEDVNNWLRVCMIDFAHVFPIEGDNPGPDSNYQFGLNNLIKICNSYL